MPNVASLQIAYGSVGAQAALDTLKTVNSAIAAGVGAAEQAYINNERYTASLTALSAAELVDSDKARDVAAAREAASIQAQRLLGFTQRLVGCAW